MVGLIEKIKFMYFIYILKSLKDNNHYVGLSKDVENRLRYHNAGRVRSTKHRTPFILIYKEQYPTRIEAREREKFLKSYEGSSEKLTIIKSL